MLRSTYGAASAFASGPSGVAVVVASGGGGGAVAHADASAHVTTSTFSAIAALKNWRGAVTDTRPN